MQETHLYYQNMPVQASTTVGGHTAGAAETCAEGSEHRLGQRAALHVPARHTYYPLKKHAEVDRMETGSGG